jgi:hypothetical protein
MTRNNNTANAVVVNNQILNNIFFSKDPNQMVSSLSSVGNDLGGFGTFDNNYYVRPLNDNTVIYNAFVDGSGKRTNNAYMLEDWKPKYGKDEGSQGSPVLIDPYKVNAVTSANKFPNPTFNSNTDYVYGWAASGNCNVSWNSDKLDGGCFQTSFSAASGNSHDSLISARIGTLSGKKNYRVKFSLLGSNTNNVSIAVYLRKSGDPYDKVSDVKYVKIASTIISLRKTTYVDRGRSQCTCFFYQHCRSIGCQRNAITITTIFGIYISAADSHDFAL